MHLAFSALVVFATISAIASSAPTWMTATGVFGSLVLVFGYARWGVRSLATGENTGPYSIALVCGVAMVAVATDAAILLSAVVVPQLFWMLALRTAIPAVAVVFVAAGLAFAGHREWDPTAWGVAGLLSVGGFATSAIVATWLSRLLHETDLRGRLISELESTRQQLAGLHHDKGVLEERARLAGEIHDSLAQGFVSIHLLLASAERDLSSGRYQRGLERIRVAREQATVQIHESRSIVATLAPVDLTRGHLAESVRTVADRFAREMSIEVEVDLDDFAVPDHISAVVLRTLQELLSNVRKHSRACRVRIELGRGPVIDAERSVRLIVIDDGCGVVEGQLVEGFGLEGLRRRLDALGGVLSIGPGVGGGTVAVAVVPEKRPDMSTCGQEMPVR